MTLVDEYLRAVAALLPKDEREDIIAELQDMILNKIEGRESELGRPLTPDETEALLREVGHPLVVAARYRGGPQQVVGPALYPYWFFLVKVSILILAAVAGIALLVRVASGWSLGPALGHAIGIIFDGGITLIGSVTLAAWVIERFKIKLPYLDSWRVRDLKVFEYAGGLDLETVKERFADRRPSGEARTDRAHREWMRSERRARYWMHGAAAKGLAAIAWGGVFILWWIGALNFGVIGEEGDLGRLGLSPGALAGIDWSELKDLLFWPVLAIAAGLVLRGVALLIYPRVPSVHGLIDIAVGATTMSVCAWLWTASPLAAAVRVDSLSELVLRTKTAFEASPPLDLAPLFTVFIAVWTFAGVCRVLRGAWLMVARPGSLAAVAAV